MSSTTTTSTNNTSDHHHHHHHHHHDTDGTTLPSPALAPQQLASSSKTTWSRLARFFPLPSMEDFLAGTAAGVSITLVGHPFDTIKVRLQTQAVVFEQAKAKAMAAATTTAPKKKTIMFRGGWDCMLHTIRNEGPLAVYKGMAGPLATVPLVNAIVFSTYEQGLAFFRIMLKNKSIQAQAQAQSSSVVEPSAYSSSRALIVNFDEEDDDDDDDDDDEDDDGLTLTHFALAGGWAGLVNTAVVTPVELVKSRLQISYERRSAQTVKQGPLSCIRQIVAARGVRGLFLGSGITASREIPAYMAQFYTYESLKRYLAEAMYDGNQDELGPVALMSSGATAGIMAWLASYPQDVIKSNIQIQSDKGPVRYKPHHIFRWDGGVINCAKSIYAKNGFRGFWVGFGPCAGRALPANAAGFYTYELVQRYFKSDDEDGEGGGNGFSVNNSNNNNSNATTTVEQTLRAKFVAPNPKTEYKI